MEADKQVIIRVTEVQRDLWKSAAEKAGKNLSEFIRDLVNPAADAIVNCPHPPKRRKAYAWQETCLDCGKRLREGSRWLG